MRCPPCVQISKSNSCLLLLYQPSVTEDAKMLVEDIDGTEEHDEPEIGLNEDELR
jgi:hypothetical protein